jgi:DNA-binding CsgD family transcriptional regulator
MFLTKEEKERRVIDLYSQGKTYRQIAEEVRISPNDIHAILKKKEEEEKNNNAVTNNQKQRQELSSRAYELFSKGKTSVEVAIALNLTEPKVSKMYRGYWKLRRLDKLIIIHKETNGKLWIVLKLYKELIKKRRMSIDQVINSVEIAIHKLPYMETLYRQAKDEAEKMQRTIQRLANDIEERKNKISFLDKIAFSSEQECKKTEQRVQELTAQKDRMEKLITNILSDDNEGYSKLKQIVKENVKAVLSENKKLISISFVALIQTLKADPEIVKLIQNISGANDDEQHKDNNNITKYLEFNKDRILDLSEKIYESLVEVLTNNAINSAVTSPDPALSVPQSSSAIPNLSSQSDIYRKEEPEIFHNSKGDIAD